MKKLFTMLLTGMFIFGVATSAFAAYSGTTQPDTMGATQYSVPMTDGDYMDNGIGNANNTGSGVEVDDGSTANELIKSDNMRMNDGTNTPQSTQRTHGEYQNNTNSCASCHQTHTGAANDLLFKSSVYNSCAACHDGTLGFYNVFATRNLDGTIPTAGTFGGTVAGNASVHFAEGFIDHNLAPGGNFAKDTTKDKGAGAWAEKFDCASCHSAHGSYSDRLLHYNPNNMANSSLNNGGKKLVQYAIADTLPAASDTSVNFVVYRTTAGAVGITTEAAAEPVIVVMEKYSPSYNTYAYRMDKTPWLYGYEFKPSYPKKYYYTTFFKTNDVDNDGVLFEYEDQDLKDIKKMYGFAYAKGTGVATAKYADIARCYVTKLAGSVYNKDTNGDDKVTSADTPSDMNFITIADFGGYAITKVNPDIYDEEDKVSGWNYGVAIGAYCGACHTDYRAKSADTTGTGMYTVAFRHTTDNNRYTCLKCHYAHGTDVTVLKDANDWTVERLTASTTTQVGDINGTAVYGKAWDQATADDYIVDKNPSSALKRYTNMAVCWKCHTDSKAAQLKNNTFFYENYDEVPHGGASGIDTDTENAW